MGRWHFELAKPLPKALAWEGDALPYTAIYGQLPALSRIRALEPDEASQ